LVSRSCNGASDPERQREHRFNAATLHGLARAATERERLILQTYYGHEGRKPLAEVTLMPPRLWREHPDPEIRRFYGKLNQYTHDILRWLCAGE
jgi:hypothetical protein